MNDKDLGWYPKSPDGDPVCPSCGMTAESVDLIGQGEIGYGSQRGVTSQHYRFQPCGHDAAYELPMDGGASHS